jgi:hypothetical protein
MLVFKQLFTFFKLRILDTNKGKQLPYTATDVILTLVLKK